MHWIWNFFNQIVPTISSIGGFLYIFYKVAKSDITEPLREQNAKLTNSIDRLNDTILSMKKDVDDLEDKLDNHENRITIMETTVKAITHIDE